jgi:mRNA-degrading endonuclease HigB of HigAB toxin-antitoxin module
LKIVAINKFAQARLQYPASEENLCGWLQIMSKAKFESESSLRSAFGDIRGFEHRFKFPIPDSSLLIHTLINFESQVAMIEMIKSGHQ